MSEARGAAAEIRQIPLAKPWLGEEEVRRASEVVRSGWLIQGPHVEEFEEHFAAMVGARHAIAVNSGSSALLVALAALGVGRGDEVICPDMSFIATATACLFLGARPVFVDIEMRYSALDPGRLEERITKRTRAIVPVHYAGHTAEMGPILEIAERYGIATLEDAAEAHLARYAGGRFAGTLGALGIFSFTPSKPMTTGEGGMIVTNDEALARRGQVFRNFGDHGKFNWSELGFNFRMPEVMAAIGLGQLARLEESVRRRREIARRYTAALSGHPRIATPVERTPEDTNYQLYTIRIRGGGAEASRGAAGRPRAAPADRDEVARRLAERGVSTRLYYPAFHHQGVFRELGPFDDADFPNAVEHERTALSLPIYPGLMEEEQVYVIDHLLDVVAE
ncbi:MAG: DegT/DnrJ/EryC1/StrS family aminotransferase [Gemmatimonadetes bacterium]|nr:DegT/DnrJ/EryC1/StrS family aminotransferase [Gemmatimonadota bacterium]